MVKAVSLSVSASAPVIVVSGLPRSGTSLMMNMLRAGGVSVVTDGERIADDDNPRGYFELEAVKQLSRGDVAWVEQAHGKAVKVISARLQHLPSSSSYKILFMRRRLPEVLASHKKMLERRGEQPDAISDAALTPLLEKHLRQVDDWISAQPHITPLDVPHHELTEHSDRQLDAIVAFLGIELDRAKMLATVDPSLHRNRI